MKLFFCGMLPLILFGCAATTEGIKEGVKGVVADVPPSLIPPTALGLTWYEALVYSTLGLGVYVVGSFGKGYVRARLAKKEESPTS